MPSYDLHKFSCIIRVTNAWNSPPNFVVLAPALHLFINHLDKFWKSQPINIPEVFPQQLRNRRNYHLCRRRTFVSFNVFCGLVASLPPYATLIIFIY